MQAPPSEVSREEAMATMTGQSHVVPPTYQNALGRASISPATEAQMQRASVVCAYFLARNRSEQSTSVLP